MKNSIKFSPPEINSESPPTQNCSTNTNWIFETQEFNTSKGNDAMDGSVTFTTKVLATPCS